VLEGLCPTEKFTFDDETFGDTEEVATPAPIPTAVVNTEWGIDKDDISYPSTEHREKITWHLAPSRRKIKLNDERYRESCDMDLLPFQAGSYASDEEELDYLESDLDANLIDRIKFEVPEGDEDIIETPDDRPG